MFTQLDCGRRSLAVLCFVVLLWGGPTISLHAQPQASASTKSPAASSNPPAYEVVSIKASDPGSTTAETRLLPNGFRYLNMSLYQTVSAAYLDGPGTKILGLPEWANSDRYDVVAKADDATAEAWARLSQADVWKQQQAMMRTLLADRCKLKVHWETKEGPVYDLVIAKDGLKMKTAAADEVSETIWKGSSTTEGFTVHAGTVESILGFAGETGRKVVDKTGLGGRKFDYEIEWTPVGSATADNPGISIFTAFEELGLKLVPSKGPVDTLVIDHLERPTPN